MLKPTGQTIVDDGGVLQALELRALHVGELPE
jgi:hypothetical protein